MAFSGSLTKCPNTHSCVHAAVRRYVVGKSCCDDIAMNFLVTSQSGQAPILIDTDVEDMVSSDSSSFSGKSTAGGWRHKRSRAVKGNIETGV